MNQTSYTAISKHRMNQKFRGSEKRYTMNQDGGILII